MPEVWKISKHFTMYLSDSVLGFVIPPHWGLIAVFHWGAARWCEKRQSWFCSQRANQHHSWQYTPAFCVEMRWTKMKMFIRGKTLPKAKGTMLWFSSHIHPCRVWPVIAKGVGWNRQHKLFSRFKFFQIENREILVSLIGHVPFIWRKLKLFQNSCLSRNICLGWEEDLMISR